jgi:hypothetical protein
MSVRRFTSMTLSFTPNSEQCLAGKRWPWAPPMRFLLASNEPTLFLSGLKTYIVVKAGVRLLRENWCHHVSHQRAPFSNACSLVTSPFHRSHPISFAYHYATNALTATKVSVVICFHKRQHKRKVSLCTCYIFQNSFLSRISFVPSNYYHSLIASLNYNSLSNFLSLPNFSICFYSILAHKTSCIM